MILLSIVLAHAAIVTVLLLARLPYDRSAGGGLRRPYPVGLPALYFAVHRYIRHRIAIVLSVAMPIG